MQLLHFKAIFFAAGLFLSLTVAADYGIFMVVKGDVLVQSKDNKSQPAKVGLKVLVGDTVRSAIDSRAKIVMSDRNVIHLSPSTTIKIEKYETGASKNVEIGLSQGKVRTDVEQVYDGEKTKFLIKTPTAVAGVRGTQFITSYDTKTNLTEVITLRGQVALSSLATSAMVLVKKGESTSMKKGQAPEPAKPVASEALKVMDRDFSDSGKESKEPKNSKDSKDSKKDSAVAPRSGVDVKDKDPLQGPGAALAAPVLGAAGGSVAPPPPPPPALVTQPVVVPPPINSVPVKSTIIVVPKPPVN